MADEVKKEEPKKEEPKNEEIKKDIDEIEVLDPTPKEYVIDGKKYIQKPLVLRELKRLIKNLSGVIAEAKKQHDDLDVLEITPEFFLSLAATVESSEKYINDTIGMLLRVCEGDEDHLKFISENLTVEVLSVIINDFFELNNVQEIIGNFTKTARKLSKNPSKKII